MRTKNTTDGGITSQDGPESIQQVQSPFVTSWITTQTPEDYGQKVSKRSLDTELNGEQRSERLHLWLEDAFH